jgi:hypothetical protein
MRKIKIEVVERGGWWQVKVCGLRHSRYRSRAAARHGAKLLAARVQKLRVQARSRQATCSSGNACASRTASCTASERYCGGDADRSRRWASAGGSRRENTCGSGGVLWTNSIIPLFASKRPSDKVLAPARCGNGHELTPDNLVPAERGARWRCRQCGAESAAAWRRRRKAAA